MRDQQERRKHDRHSTDILSGSPEVWLTVHGGIASISPLKASVLNVSCRGLCLVSDAPLEPGQILKFHDSSLIEPLPHHSIALPKTGIVLWASETMAGYRFGVLNMESG